jgi:hypothetical protein
VREIDEIPEDDVNQDMEVVGVKILGSRSVAKNEIQEFEDQQLEGGFRFPVQEEDEVAAEGLVGHAVSRYSLDNSVRDAGSSVVVMVCGSD